MPSATCSVEVKVKKCWVNAESHRPKATPLFKTTSIAVMPLKPPSSLGKIFTSRVYSTMPSKQPARDFLDFVNASPTRK